MQGKIQQQYYTRGRKGIFRLNEGLDTVAKSPSLDNAFIRKTLHPFCLYHAPQELRQRGERDLSKYPESLTVFTAESGELVIGRGAFAGADFTGQRDTIFVHQYVVPSERAEQAYRNPDSIFRIRFFESRYSEGRTSLPELDELDYESGPSPDEERETLEQLGIGELRFKQLLWAVFMSVASNKKVYIALDVDVSDSSPCARRLFGIIYRCLPYPLRRKFGFTTYNNEPQGKKLINAMVVEKGSIRAGDRSLDKDYVFDFPNRRFLNVELPEAVPYLDFAWTLRERPDELDAFYAFAEEALQDRGVEQQTSLSAYDRLCALYLAERGDDGLYEADKEGCLAGALAYLNKDNVGRKPRLERLFWSFVDKEVALLGTGHVPSPAYMETLIDYVEVGGVQDRLVASLIRCLYNSWNFHEDSGIAEQVFRAMTKHGALFRETVRHMLHTDPYPPVVHAYLLDRLEPIRTMPELQDEITFWVERVEEALCEPFFQEQLVRKTKEVLAKDRERIAAARGLNVFLDKLYKAETEHVRRLREFYNDLDVQAQQTIIAHVELNRMTWQQLEGMHFMLDHHTQVLSESLGSRDREVFELLLCAVFLLRDEGAKEAENYMTLHLLAPVELEQLQDLLRRLLKDKLRSAYYDKIAYAFYVNGTEPGACSFAYAEMLDYVLRQSAHADDVYDFLHWSATYPYFLDVRGRIAWEFEGAIRGYFLKTENGSLTKRDVWKKLKSTPNASFKAVYEDIRLKQSNPFVRLFRKNRKILLRLGALLAGVALLTAVALFVFRSPPEPIEPASPGLETEQPAQGGTGSQQPGGQPGTQQGGQPGTQQGGQSGAQQGGQPGMQQGGQSGTQQGAQTRAQ